MILNIILICAILYASLELESKFKIANPIFLIILTSITKFFYPEFMGFIDLKLFTELMLIFIVILVLGDAYILKFADVKKRWLSLTYLAGIAIIISILLGIIIGNTIFDGYNLSVGAIIVLFAMCLPTDPVAVVSVFKQFKLPHDLKFLVEGESLFNDAVALILFNAFGLFLLTGGILTIGYSISASMQIIIGSSIIGLIVGFIGVTLMKTTNDTKSELILVILTAYLAFFCAEHVHIIGGTSPMSGLLSEIVAIITLTTIIHKSFKYEERRINKSKQMLIDNIDNNDFKRKSTTKRLVEKIIVDITDRDRHKEVGEFLNVIALFVNGVLFVSLVNIVNFDNMIKYWKEILAMFIVTTIIRMITMGFYAFIANNTNKMPHIDLKWWSVLLFAGIKGGLSIVMIHILGITCPNFEYLAMFEAIIVGVILLSIFIYVPMLMLVINLNKNSFENEYNFEQKHH